MRYRIGYYTGPAGVAFAARALARQGVNVLEGTERVYFLVDAPDAYTARHDASWLLGTAGQPALCGQDSVALHRPEEG